jgi:hypothetical protein
MGLAHSPSIISDGLVFYLDAANRRSYSGSGLTVNGLVGGIGGTLINGTGFSTANNGTFIFDGTNDYILCDGISQNNNASALTWTVWTKRNASNSLMTFMQLSGLNNDIGLELWSNEFIYFEIGNGGNTYGELSNNSSLWQNVTMVYNGSGADNSARLKAYINGVQESLSYNGTIPSTAGTANTLFIGNTSPYASVNSNLFSSGNLGSFQSYNRALSATEILQNYNATRKRFGL